MKAIKKLIIMNLVLTVILAISCINVFAATVGQQLTQPEAGWQRIDDTDSKIRYVGSLWKFTSSDTNWYNNNVHYMQPMAMSINDIPNNYVTFKFKGTKIRFIDTPNIDQPNKMDVTIDGVIESYSQNSNLIKNVIVYEKLGLQDTVHTVTIKCNPNSNDLRILWDAIDIDDTGYLVDSSAPTNLKAAPGNLNVTLTWDAVAGATSYNVKRATTAGGAYTTIATNVTGTTYTDTTAVNGTTYYYVISAISANGESVNSNEASATPTALVIGGNKAILEITMTNGTEKEYDLTAAELQSFLDWYDGKSNGTGKAYYVFIKKNNIKPFLSRKEYIAFDKILSFEVKDYNE